MLASILVTVVSGGLGDTAQRELPLCDHPSLLQHSLALHPERRDDTHSLFVKFHKVAGTTWQSYVDVLTGGSEGCSMTCGDAGWNCRQYFPPGEDRKDCFRWEPSARAACPEWETPRACTYHASLGVLRQAVTGRKLVAANMLDLTSPDNLWSDSKRLELLSTVEWARTWLPPSFQSKRLVTTTVLRDPAERIRSFYYFRNEDASHENFMSFLEFRRDFVAGNWTQEQFEAQANFWKKGAETMAFLRRSCCEYEYWLGDGSVEKSQVVLSTQFDLVAITERLNEGLVGLGKLYGISVNELANIARAMPQIFENSDGKLEWTADELYLANYIAEKGNVIYSFAQELFERQSVKLFGRRQNWKAAVAAFEAANPDSES
mmetsp:Transcript_60026/g.112151  ORF Transcript_60026/g.112151 Transcript_60026/m.112151 type:complete len:376 (-) Transcript_60026:75-1202(-)